MTIGNAGDKTYILVFLKQIHQSFKTKELQLKNSRRVIDLMVGCTLAYLSLPVVANLVSSGQVRHSLNCGHHNIFAQFLGFSISLHRPDFKFLGHEYVV